MSPHRIKPEQKALLLALGERIAAIRKAKGLTLAEVGERIGKDRQSISSLEKGQFNPSYVYLLELCKGLDIELADLVSSPRGKNTHK